MPPLKLGERYVEAAVAKLKTGMAARIAVINADAVLRAFPNGDFDLATPDTGSGYYTSGLSAIPATPALIVAEGPTQFGEEGPHSFLTGTGLDVWILEADPDRQRLGKRLQRQARAVIETLWDDDPREALNDGAGNRLAYRLMPAGTAPGRVFDPDTDDSYRGFYLVSFACQAAES